MKRTVELDTLKIADRLSKVCQRLHIARLACDGIEEGDDGGSLIANMIYEIEEEIEEISDVVHPPKPEEEIASVTRMARSQDRQDQRSQRRRERGMTAILWDRVRIWSANRLLDLAWNASSASF